MISMVLVFCGFWVFSPACGYARSPVGHPVEIPALNGRKIEQRTKWFDPIRRQRSGATPAKGCGNKRR
uniref:Putative secreted protein n=1 Tax=Anopheles darlingi TaxID=43151 RepID=A0A2M4DA12_ANODA